MTDQKLKEYIIQELEKAEKIWNDVKDDILEKRRETFSAMNESYTPSAIPGFPYIKNGEGKVGNFTAMVLDIRDSTSHLLNAISNSKNVSQLQRVYYETTAINTAGILIVNEFKGSITEFLGDGFLALFETEKDTDVYKVKNAAEKCLRVVLDIINPILFQKYGLPSLKIGIGLAYSKAIVTTIGIENQLHPKALGECVFRASKLSNGNNEIFYDEKLKLFWPKSNGGKLSFTEKKHKNTEHAKAFVALKKD